MELYEQDNEQFNLDEFGRLVVSDSQLLKDISGGGQGALIDGEGILKSESNVCCGHSTTCNGSC